ncbi:uncharacterized protein ACO6RY_01543 [Pungitius sinensis]
MKVWLRPWRLTSLPTSCVGLQSSSTHQPIEKTPLNGRPSLIQTYGKNRPLSFLYRGAHYSLKIPPKKRRRFSETFLPLSHGFPVSAQVYERYPGGLGAALYREHFDFNAEPPWDPS